MNGFLTVEVPKGSIGNPALKNRGRSMAPEVAVNTDKNKLQRQKPDMMKILTERKGSSTAAGACSPREGSG
jgi:hypothetical protein